MALRGEVTCASHTGRNCESWGSSPVWLAQSPRVQARNPYLPFLTGDEFNVLIIDAKNFVTYHTDFSLNFYNNHVRQLHPHFANEENEVNKITQEP